MEAGGSAVFTCTEMQTEFRNMKPGASFAEPTPGTKLAYLNVGGGPGENKTTLDLGALVLGATGTPGPPCPLKACLHPHRLVGAI